MTTQSKNETIRKFFDSLNAGDVDRAASLLGPECVEHGGGHAQGKTIITV